MEKIHTQSSCVKSAAQIACENSNATCGSDEDTGTETRITMDGFTGKRMHNLRIEGLLNDQAIGLDEKAVRKLYSDLARVLEVQP